MHCISNNNFTVCWAYAKSVLLSAPNMTVKHETFGDFDDLAKPFLLNNVKIEHSKKTILTNSIGPENSLKQFVWPI